MSAEIEFVGGLIVKAPNDGAPDYVKGKLSFKREELITWLQSRDGEWVNADIKVAKSGKWYAAVDNWKPNQGNTSSSGSRGGAPQRERPAPATSAPADDFEDSDIPFITSRGVF